jgi:protein involved in polysaccharide export with SLBB domain
MPPSCRLGRLLYAVALVAACVARPALGQTGGSPSGTAASRGEVARTVAPAADSARAVGVGDRVLLRVWQEPTWSDSLMVGTDGDLVLPRIGRYHAAGMDPAALRDTIQRRLGVYLRDPSVDVVVLRRVAVLGAVRKPDVYFVDAVSTLRDVLARAGGLTDDANADRVEIVRDGERTKLGKWNAIASSTVPVRSGDEIQVGRKSWIARNTVSAISSFAVAVSVLITALRR